ncbi:MAG: IS200/IS605 family transposase [Planctomycetota bacterium]
MAGTFTNLNFHIVFSTKDRSHELTKDIRENVYGYIGGIIRGIGGSLIKIGGVEDHVHILCSLKADVSVAEAVRKIKSNASKWIKREFLTKDSFAWQGGYAAFTVSKSQQAIVENYIENQEEHHRQKSFKEELIGFLKVNDLPYEEQYLT